MSVGGAPLKYGTPEELQAAVDKYFDDCENNPKVRDVYNPKTGETLPTRIYRPQTVEGLAFDLGITRKSLLNYQGRDEFKPIVERAKARIEMWKTEQVWNGLADPRVYQFDMMNNSGYKKEAKTDVILEVGTIKPQPPEHIQKQFTGEE